MINRKCVICQVETRPLANEHKRLKVPRLCGTNCRNVWLRENKERKAHGIEVAKKELNSLYGKHPTIVVLDEFHDVGDGVL